MIKIVYKGELQEIDVCGKIYKREVPVDVEEETAKILLANERFKEYKGIMEKKEESKKQ